MIYFVAQKKIMIYFVKKIKGVIFLIIFFNVLSEKFFDLIIKWYALIIKADNSVVENISFTIELSSSVIEANA